SSERRSSVGVGDDLIENLMLLPPKLELGVRDGGGANVVIEVLHHHQAIRLWIRERTEQERIHQAENGRIGSDSNCQHQHRDQREPGILSQDAQGKANILIERLHTSPFVSFDWAQTSRLAAKKAPPELLPLKRLEPLQSPECHSFLPNRK